MSQPIHHKKHLGFGVIEVIPIIVAVGIIGLVGWTFFANQKPSQPQPSPESSNQTPNKSVESTTTIYTDEVIGVRFSYPKGWVTLKCSDRPQSLYLASDNRGIGKENDNSILCGGGTDFPPQVYIRLKTDSKRGADLVEEQTRGGSSLAQELTIDNKKAYKFVYLANDQVGGMRPSGFELTTYYIETDKGVLEVGYNQWPKTVETYDTSDASKAAFLKLVESLRIL